MVWEIKVDMQGETREKKNLRADVYIGEKNIRYPNDVALSVYLIFS